MAQKKLKSADKTLENMLKKDCSITDLIYGENLSLHHRSSMAAAYAEYLNTFVTTNDKRYLTDEAVMNRLVPVRGAVGTYVMTEKQFAKEQALKNRPLGMSFYFSEGKFSDDPLIQALAEREKSNTTKSLATIIFICTRNSNGLTISGYIDYEQCLRRYKSGDSSEDRNWSQIFAGRQSLKPSQQDLSYMNWKSGIVLYNDTDNFKNLPLSKMGLRFQFKGDNSIIKIEECILGGSRMCFEIDSPKHGSAVLYDHRVRRPS